MTADDNTITRCVRVTDLLRSVARRPSRAGRSGWSRGQALGELDEVQVRPPGNPEPLLAIRKGPGAPGQAVPPPLVPGDQVPALGEHGHDHDDRAPLLAGQSFGFGQDLLPPAAALPAGPHREHPEVDLAAG